MMPDPEGKQQKQVVVHGGICALGPQARVQASIQITDGYITGILSEPPLSPNDRSSCTAIDLSGFLIMPGLINAHDHLEFALFPRLADPPYRNYIEWGTDIHNKFPDIIAKHRAVPKDLRVWWGGIRNLLCGVTTVSHHNPLRAEMQREDFPVRVIQEYGWGHSLALGGDLIAARSATPEGRAFLVHACEGVDEVARVELLGFDRLGLLDDHTVLVHGLAIDHDGVALMRERNASLIVCPSSNNFLFEKLPDMSVLGAIDNVALGNDSPLTAEGDLLDEIRFAIRLCGISSLDAYRMVTENPALILRLENGEGAIRVSGIADLIAFRDTGCDAAHRLQALSMVDVEFVMLGGRVQLASEAVLERLPLSEKHGLEPVWIDGTIRWLRTPVKELLQKTEEALGKGELRLSGKQIRIPA
ncbi:amidohydrolase family protein [Acidicapsa ligni]|uniref:amidohydrolase family protein n=1 Tax=Acidicapsa ligni TaxID=542300 RepID=UPI0021E007A3|nr:amidohydrolase family protein [Acidicapsa ligni]